MDEEHENIVREQQMHDQRNLLRISLRAMFVLTVFVGLGLTALMNPSYGAYAAVNYAMLFLFGYAVVAAIVYRGSRRLFWAAFAAILLVRYGSDGDVWTSRSFEPVMEIFHPDLTRTLDDGSYGVNDRLYTCGRIAHNLLSVILSTAGGYALPWLVQRGRNKEA